MEELHDLREIYKLKRVYRQNSVEKRKESSAEHSWSCLVLADYFLSKTDRDIDRLEVYELLIYHDLVEIDTGDIPLRPGKSRKGKEEMEEKAEEKLEKVLPEPTGRKFRQLFRQFEAQETIEAKFSKAVDGFDAVLHEADYKEDWEDWTEEFLREKKEPLFEEFPEISESFEKIVEHFREEGFL